MSTISRTARTSRRYSAAELDFIEHHAALLGYITTRLPAADWHTAEELAQETWARALSRPRHDTTVDSDGLPGWLAHQARITLRRHLSPVPEHVADWFQLTQILGHASEWPEHWHRVLVDDGQAALLRVAVTDLRRGPTVRPTPATVFGRRAAPALAAAA